jgi:hypothetical protein
LASRKAAVSQLADTPGVGLPTPSSRRNGSPLPRATFTRPEGGPGVLRAAEAEVLPALPICTHVSRAWLMTGTQAPGSWQLRATFSLGT